MNASFVPAVHQAAGHKGSLVAPDGMVFAKLTTQQEIDFFTQTQILSDDGAVDDSPLGLHLSDWMPVYMGILTEGDVVASTLPSPDPLLQQPPLPFFTAEQHEQLRRRSDDDESLALSDLVAQQRVADRQYIVLQNLLYGFQKPSILDIKLGRVLHDDAALPEKRERLTRVSDTTTLGSMGFRVCGMKTYYSLIDHPCELINLPPLFRGINETVTVKPELLTQLVYLEFNKHYGRRLTAATCKQGLLLYFQLTQLAPQLVARLVRKFLVRLEVLYNCILESRVRMVLSSLLFVYENDLTKWSKVLDNVERYDECDPLLRDDFDADSDDDDDDAPLSSLNIIDFAHSRYVEDSEPDHNVLDGLMNLIATVRQIADEISND